MSSPRMTRRTLLSRAAAGAAALGTSALVARGAPGANDRISIGCIGVGGRGSMLMNDIHGLAKQHNVAITAVCDVWKVNLDAAAKRATEWFGQAPRTFTRFGDLLALDDVDAVVIATPDFGHTPILIEALRAGKDAYVEKPMSMTIDGANTALALAREKQRVVQAGTQRRSEGAFKAATRVLGTGVLGPIVRVTAAINFNEPRWARGYDDCKEADVDWDAYLFNRPKHPFDPKRLRRWHFYKDYTNGLSGLWMAHYSDAVHMITGAKYPASAVAHGGIYRWKDGREHTDTFHAVMDYPEGFLFDWGMSLTNSAGPYFTVHGPLGTYDVETSTLSGAGGAGDKKIAATRKIAPEGGESHMGNWLECLRTRKRPNADIEYGHQHAVATILAAAALETGRRHVYDAAKREMRPG